MCRTKFNFMGRNTSLLVNLLFLFLAVPCALSQSSSGPSSCAGIIGRLPHDASSFGQVLFRTPRNAIRPKNLIWELPIAGAIAALIETGADAHVDNHIRDASFVRDSSRASNVGIGIEIGAAGLMYVADCYRQRSSYLANTGWTALEAMGAANLVTLGMKALTNRQYPFTKNMNGEFWEGGKSFPSGHAATSFAFASVVAHRYPHNFWAKVGVYGLATGVSLARVGGHKHFPSDVLVGATIGYISGTYLTHHAEDSR